MRLIHFHDAADWGSGVYAGSWLNTDLYSDPVTGYPALAPLSAGTLAPAPHDGATLIAGALATPNGGHAWTVHNRYLITNQSGDTLTFSPPANTLYLDIAVAARASAGMVDSAGNVWGIYAGGAANQDATAGPLRAGFLRGGVALALRVDGVQVPQAVDTGDGRVHLIRVTLDGLSAHTVLILHSGSTMRALPPGDTAELVVLGMVTTAGSAGVGRVWTGPVLDGLAPEATWIGADWVQAAAGALTTYQVAVGQTPTPDGSWTTQVCPQGALTQGGLPHGRVGFVSTLGGPLVGRYAQVTLTLPATLPAPGLNGSSVPWVRDMEIYTSVPQTDTLTLLRFPPALRGGGLAQSLAALAGALVTKVADDTTMMVESAASIGTARGPYLRIYGHDLGLDPAPGEPQALYAARLRGAFAGRLLGGNASFVVTQLAAYIGGVVTITAYGGVATPWRYTLSIAPVWTNPVTRAQITAYLPQISPAGHIPTLVYL